MERLLRIMAKLRSPEGCPWDRQQTHESLRPYVIEEAYEVVEAVDSGCRAKLAEELGDLLLQVVFHAQIASEHGDFTLDDVVAAICEKLERSTPTSSETSGLTTLSRCCTIGSESSRQSASPKRASVRRSLTACPSTCRR